MKKSILAITLCVVLAVPAFAQAGVRLGHVGFSEASGGQGIDVRLHTSAPVQAFSEPQVLADGTIEIILFNTSLDSAFTREAPFGPVGRVRIVPSDGHLKLYLDPSGSRPLSASAYLDRNTSDVLMHVTYGAKAAPLAGAEVFRNSALDTAAAEGLASPLKQARRRWKLDTIVIDAGHGGRDDGATANGVREKDVTLGVALKLGRLIEQQLGCRVVYTRTNDRFVTLRERGHVANREGAKLFISIHANAAPNRAATGTETYFLGMHKTEAARTVMQRENSVVAYEDDPSQYGGYTEGQLILRALAQSAYMRKSEELAGMVESKLTAATGSKSRGVKQAGFYVLWSASMPSILVELGFVTNPREAAFLASAFGQEYLANAIFCAVRDFKEQYDKDLDVASTW
ncbi:MAG TPA: N-acetylmuramoyl-L-alanine amidase [Rhodothermales bacterium]|nr:N-acetylmuramoyl-L-alanine amidase [Rhodothermales bacterium]